MQFYIVIAIPSILVVLSWMQQDKRLARIESLIDSMRAENIAFRDSTHRDNITLRDSIHHDMIALHERVATVETRQG